MINCHSDISLIFFFKVVELFIFLCLWLNEGDRTCWQRYRKEAKNVYHSHWRFSDINYNNTNKYKKTKILFDLIPSHIKALIVINFFYSMYVLTSVLQLNSIMPSETQSINLIFNSCRFFFSLWIFQYRTRA